MTNDKVASIGFWQGNGAADAVKDISAAYKKLSDIYNISQVNYAAEKNIPEDLDTLIIVSPKEKFNGQELKALDGFLTRGGSLVVLANGVAVEPGLEAKKNDLGLNKIFEAYGVKLNNNLALDVNNGLASFSQGFMVFTTNYPYWPKVVKSGFDQNNLAVALTGKFGPASAKPGHLVLAGNGDFISDSFLRNYPDNLVFFQNAVDGLSLGDDLITIRSKGVTERPIKEITEPIKVAVRYANIFGLTMLVALFGLARYCLRRRKDK